MATMTTQGISLKDASMLEENLPEFELAYPRGLYITFTPRAVDVAEGYQVGVKYGLRSNSVAVKIGVEFVPSHITYIPEEDLEAVMAFTAINFPENVARTRAFMEESDFTLEDIYLGHGAYLGLDFVRNISRSREADDQTSYDRRLIEAFADLPNIVKNITKGPFYEQR